MARRAEDWRLRFDERRGVYYLRGRWKGRRYHESTGTSDLGAAEEVKARRYAEVVSGRRAEAGGRRRVDEVAAEWLASLNGSLDEQTIAKYDQYTRAWWGWVTLDRVTGPAVEDWWRARLRTVTRRTVIKQLYALGSFLRWAKSQGWIDAVPAWDPPPRSSTGTRAEGRTVVEVVPISEAEAARILEAAPEWSERSRKGKRGKWRVRDRLTVAWETALRPATLDALEAPGDYRRGAAMLRIRDAADKSRFGREVPLTPEARAALDRSCPDAGLIFGRVDSHNATDHLRDAARAAGLGERAERIKPYDLRHARLTLLAERGNLVGLAYLAGHKAITTTNRYVHAHEEAAREVLGIGPHTGREAKPGKGRKR